MATPSPLARFSQMTAPRLSTGVALLLLTLAALGIRMWGADFGLPYAYHVDEHFYYPYAWAMGQGQLDLPDQSHGPSLYLATLLLGQQIARVTTQPNLSTEQFGALIEIDPSPFLLSARLISALAGALTIPLVFLMGRRYRDERLGWTAALIMTVVFFHVRDSHFGVPDSFMTWFVAATGWLALRAHQTGRRFDFWLAGAAAGLAAASKYTSAFVVVPVRLAAFRLPHSTARRTLARCQFAVFGLLVGFVIGYPNLLINFPAFVKDISFLWIRVGGGFEGWRLEPDNSALFYLSTFVWSIGLPMMVLSAMGSIVALIRRRAADVLMIAFPIVYFVAMSLSRGHFGRYMIPELPFLAVLSAEAGWIVVPSIVQRASRHKMKDEGRRARSSIGQLASLIDRPSSWGIMALLLVILPNAANSLRADWLLAQPDTRTVAKRWIEANIPAGARIAVEWPYHTPPLSNGYTVPPDSTREYWIDLVWGFGLADRPISQYQTDGTRYLISTNYTYDIPVEDPKQQTVRETFYAELPRVFKAIKTFSPRCDGGEPEFVFDQLYGPAVGLWDACLAGPMIKIYQVQ